MTFETITSLNQSEKDALARTVLQWFLEPRSVSTMHSAKEFSRWDNADVKMMRHSLANAGLIEIAGDRKKNGTVYRITDSGHRYLRSAVLT